MTETGIYGGSFNPIHRGHVELAERLCRDEGLDELWFMVSPQNPFKKSSPDLLNENIRLELARMAVREHPCLKVSDFEFRLPRPSYTADTLAALRQAYPDRLFTLVIGADNWLAFKDWKKPDEILSHHRILVYPRPGYAVEAASLPPGVKLTDTPLIDISSTEIRRLISQGDDASYGLDEATVSSTIQQACHIFTASFSHQSRYADSFIIPILSSIPVLFHSYSPPATSLSGRLRHK